MADHNILFRSGEVLLRRRLQDVCEKVLRHRDEERAGSLSVEHDEE
jgi:hypothetical protein